MPKPLPVFYWLVAVAIMAAFCAGLWMAVRSTAPSDLQVIEEAAFERQLRRQVELRRQCYRRGHVPVMGFGMSVVCVNGVLATEYSTTEELQQGAKNDNGI